MMEILGFIWNIYLTISVLFTSLCLLGFVLTKRLVEKERSGAVTKTDESTVKLVYIEVIGEKIMMYDSLTNAFIAQGKTPGDLAIIAAKKFPGLKVVVAGTDSIDKKSLT